MKGEESERSIFLQGFPDGFGSFDSNSVVYCWYSIRKKVESLPLTTTKDFVD